MTLANKRKNLSKRDKIPQLTQNDNIMDSKFYLFENSTTLIMKNDNPYILSGFREDTANDIKKCFQSLFKLHNDTLNVWTHLIGGIWLSYLVYKSYIYAGPNERTLDVYVICGYLILASICLFTSAFYHLFRTYSVSSYIFLLTLDIMGITFQIFGSTFLATYFEFICHPFWQNIYLSLLIFFALLTAIFVPHLVRHRKTNLRSIILIFFASVGIVGWFHHYTLVDSHYNQYNSHSLFSILGTYFCIISGMLIRRAHVPERFSPGTFDIWLSSHQIFHVASAIGAYYLFIGYKQIHDWALHNCSEPLRY